MTSWTLLLPALTVIEIAPWWVGDSCLLGPPDHQSFAGERGVGGSAANLVFSSADCCLLSLNESNMWRLSSKGSRTCPCRSHKLVCRKWEQDKNDGLPNEEWMPWISKGLCVKDECRRRRGWLFDARKDLLEDGKVNREL
jgi:hypothetical protein